MSHCDRKSVQDKKASALSSIAYDLFEAVNKMRENTPKKIPASSIELNFSLKMIKPITKEPKASRKPQIIAALINCSRNSVGIKKIAAKKYPIKDVKKYKIS